MRLQRITFITIKPTIMKQKLSAQEKKEAKLIAKQWNRMVKELIKKGALISHS